MSALRYLIGVCVSSACVWHHAVNSVVLPSAPFDAGITTLEREDFCPRFDNILEEKQYRMAVINNHYRLLPLAGPDEYVPELKAVGGGLRLSLCRLHEIELSDWARAGSRIPDPPQDW